MSRRPQTRFPTRQRALSDRCSLAPDADKLWRPDANWRAWTGWLQPPTDEVYRLLRRAAQGQRRFKSALALAQEVAVGNRTLQIILDDLDALDLIRLRRNRRGTIIGIEVNDPPLLPEDMPAPLRGLVYNIPPTAEADARRAVNYWAATWEKHRGVPYEVTRHERGLVKSMLTDFGLDRLKRMMRWVIADPHHEIEDEVIRRSDLSIGTFKARINQIAPAWHRAEEIRRNQARMIERQKADRALRSDA